MNAGFRLRRSTFRLYLHAPAAIDARLRETGLRRATVQRTAFWEIAFFERRAPGLVG